MPEKRPLKPESRDKLDKAMLDLAEFTNVVESDVKRAGLVAAKILQTVEKEHASQELKATLDASAPGDPPTDEVRANDPPAKKAGARRPRTKAASKKKAA
jgi:hypothetical protein